MNEISNMMFNDHLVLDNLLKEFTLSTNLEDKKSQLKALEKLKWRFERHILVEEKEIFEIFNPKENEGISIINGMLADHKDIIKMLIELQDLLEMKKDVDVSKLNQLWSSHESKERILFYPKLDQILDNKRKKELIERIHTKI